MPFNFFEQGIANGMIQLPNDAIRDQQQAAISEKWDATTARRIIKEQCDYGSKDYHDIEVWIDYVTGMTSRGQTNGDDFRKLLFESIDHPVKKGLYYKFDGNTWITYFTDKYSSLDVDIGVRRCNNCLRIIDPENGSIFSIPCVVEYDMTAPSIQVSNSILTPNNHAIIKVQGNKDTVRLFKLNTRYILGGRPFKLLAYQNALIDKTLSSVDTLLQLELFLDEKQDGDDIENQIANNGKYDYNIIINSHDMTLIKGNEGHLSATVTLNGEEVNRNIIWESLNESVVKIDSDGNYKIVGDDNTDCVIMATLNGNPDIMDFITIKVSSSESLSPKIIIEPLFNKLHQYETINFTIKIVYGNQEIIPEKTSVSLSEDISILSNKYIDIEKDNNNYQVSGKNISYSKQYLFITAENKIPNFKVKYKTPIDIVSIMD